MIFFWLIGKQDRSTSSNGKNRRNRVSVRISSFHSSVPLFPLLVAAVHDAADISRVDVKLVDVASVAIVGQLDGQQATGNVMAARGLICLAPTGRNKDAAPVRVLDPANGAASPRPTSTRHGGG